MIAATECDFSKQQNLNETHSHSAWLKSILSVYLEFYSVYIIIAFYFIKSIQPSYLTD